MSDAEKYVGRGYAPGGYCCICLTCNGQFIGEKRSWCCLGCAKSADRIEQLEAELAEARMQALSELGQAQEAYEAQKKAEAERDAAYAKGYEAAEQELPAYQNAAYKRGLEDTAEMCAARAKEVQQRSLPVSAFNELVEMAVAIRAQIQESDK